MKQNHRKTCICTFLCLVSISTFLFAQAPDTLWTKTYDGDDSRDVGYTVQQTTDGGYIVVGYKTFYATHKDLCLIRTDSDGNIEWEKIYGGDDEDIGRGIAQTLDGGYIVTGSTMSFGYNWCDAWLLKTDENGDTLWTKRYGWTNGDVNGYSVQQTTDGGYIVAGYETSHMLLIKTDSIGDTLWLREYGTSGNSRGFSVQQTTDGGYITAGWYNYIFYLVKTDAFGDTVWSTQYGSGAFDRLYSVIQTHDGGYLATGGFAMPYDNRSSDVGLMKTDSLGAIEWFYTYGNSIRSDVGYSVIETSNKEFVVVGSTHPDTSDYYNTYLFKTDTLGNEIWSTQYPGPGEDWGHCVQETSDNGYIIAGWVNGYDSWGDIRLIKTAPDTLGVQENKVCIHTSNIVIYPNPFYHDIYIEFNTSTDIPYTAFAIYDIEGRLVEELYSGLPTEVGNRRITWDGCDNSGRQLPAGVYFLHVKQEDFTAVKKLILLR